jgi:hypothetical protein
MQLYLRSCFFIAAACILHGLPSSLPSGCGICFIRSSSNDINLSDKKCVFHESTLPICVIPLNAFSILLYFHLFSGNRHPLIVTRHYHSGDNVICSGPACPNLMHHTSLKPRADVHPLVEGH